MTSVAFSPDGRLLAAASTFPKRIPQGRPRRGEIIIWEAASGRELDTLTQHKEGISSLAFSPGGEFLATGSRDHLVGLWHLELGMMVHAFRGHAAAVTRVAFSPDGKLLVSGGEDQSIRFWDVAELTSVACLKPARAGSCDLAFSPDGKSLAACWTSKGPVVLCDTTTLQELGRLQLPAESDAPAYALAFSPGGRTLAVIAGESVVLWNLGTWQVKHSFPAEGSRALAWSPDGETLATGGWETAESSPVHLRDSRTGESRLALAGHKIAVTALAWSPDGKLLATASRDMTVRLWDLAQL